MSSRRRDDTFVGTVEVLVEGRVARLGLTFTYSVPARLKDQVALGCRVRIPLAGGLADGFVVAIDPSSDFEGRLLPLDAVVSAIPVLSPEVHGLCTRVADHYCGSVADVVRLAVPPRAAAVERGWRPVESRTTRAATDPTGWLARQGLVRAAASGKAARGGWSVPASTDWVPEIVSATSLVAATGRGVLIVAPDGRDVARIAAAARAVLQAHEVAILTADAGPRERYQQFLHVLSGQARVVIGTRGAAFAPIRDPGLIIVWDDGDSSLAELRAPYPHAREVLAIRSHLQSCALLLAGHARSCEAQRWLDAGWMTEVRDRTRARGNRPRGFSTADAVRSPFDLARTFPEAAVDALRQGLRDGPVLVQVSRTGYVPLTACQQCRAIAECQRCGGPLALLSYGEASCRRCGWSGPFTCPGCGSAEVRAVKIGAVRTGEELGRLFPGTPVLISTSDHAIDTINPHPVVVVATAGLEPRVAGGYRAGFLPDAQSDLWRTGVRSREEAVRRWFNGCALMRPGAPVAIGADPDESAVQSLIRWDPGGFATAELARRADLGLPPARQIVQIDGHAPDIAAIVASVEESIDAEVLGPRPIEDDPDERFRVLLRSRDFAAMARRLHEIGVARAAGHVGKPVRVQVDPVVLD